jgi:Flp pilus assembly pilin Flp
MKRFLQNQNGATAIEYCLIASLIGFVLIGALTTIGGGLSDGLMGLMDGFS